MFEYTARLDKVVDGDTIHADVDLGFSVHIHADLRLDGINAPEMVGLTHAAGVRAKEYLTVLLLDGNGDPLMFTIRTRKDRIEKYGRMLATIILPDGSNANQRMIDSGNAVAYSGGPR